MNNYYEIYNYLNIVNRRLGKLYKLSGYNPLPKDFVFDDECVKEVFIFSQMKNETVIPPFIYEGKRAIKKHFKTALKHSKSILKHESYAKFVSKEFAEKLGIYFAMRIEIAEFLLKNFKKQGADEVELYREIYNLNPILGEFMLPLYDDKFSADVLFQDLEKQYNLSYSEKLKLINKKQNKQTQKQAEETNQKNLHKSKELQKIRKNVEKTAKNNEKIKKNQEIEKVKTENIKRKKEKIKES